MGSIAGEASLAGDPASCAGPKGPGVPIVIMLMRSKLEQVEISPSHRVPRLEGLLFFKLTPVGCILPIWKLRPRAL